MVVDLGCGSSVWCVKVADEFMNTRVVAVDISPFQPTLNVPISCTFSLINFSMEYLSTPDRSTMLNRGTHLTHLTISSLGRLWY